MKLLHFLLVAFLATAWAHVRAGHNCQHDEIMKSLEPVHPHEHTISQFYYNHPMDKTLNSQTKAIDLGWQPIRILLDFTHLSNSKFTCLQAGAVVSMGGETFQCTQEDVLTTEKKNFLTGALSSRTKEWFSWTLSVQPVQGTLNLGTKCYQYADVPSSIRTVSGYDFVLMVTAAPTEGATIAWALTCQSDQFGRPILGQANFGPSRLSTAIADWDEQLSTAIHEISHALGFSSSKFGDFRDANGNLRGTNNVVRQFNERGVTVSRIVTPAVAKAVMDQFDCATMTNPGAELEDFGGSGTAGSHWEKRIFRNEFMTGTSTPNPVYSAVSLALFEDSGWYKVNYTNAETLLWGYKAGCSFASQKCNSWPGTQFFCSDSEYEGCTHDYIIKGYCNVASYSTSLPASYQYFSDARQGGRDQHADYCPFIDAYSNGDCRFESNSNSQSTSVFGEFYGSMGRCFTSNLQNTKYQAIGAGPRCFEHSCETKTDGKVYLKVKPNGASTWFECPYNGGRINTVSYTSNSNPYSGYIDCPPAYTHCVTPTHSIGCLRECSGHGSCVNNMCHCQAGWSGEDCSVHTSTCVDSDCNGHGKCDATTNMCLCDSGWSGLMCTVASSVSVTALQNGVYASAVSLTSGNFAYYSFEVPAGRSVTIVATADSGNPNLYINNLLVTMPSTSQVQSDKLPTVGTHVWSDGRDGSDSIQILSGDVNLVKSGRLVIGVTSGGSSTTTRVKATLDTQTCPMNCNGRGACSNGVCQCISGYTGVSCEAMTCPGDGRCSGNGYCMSGKCVCVGGYTGTQCEKPKDSTTDTTQPGSTTPKTLTGTVPLNGWAYVTVSCGGIDSWVTGTLTHNAQSDAGFYANTGLTKPTSYSYSAHDYTGWSTLALKHSLTILCPASGCTFGIHSDPYTGMQALQYSFTAVCQARSALEEGNLVCPSNNGALCSGHGNCTQDKYGVPYCECEDGWETYDCSQDYIPIEISAEEYTLKEVTKSVSVKDVDAGTWRFFSLSLDGFENSGLLHVSFSPNDDDDKPIVFLRKDQKPTVLEYDASSSLDWFDAADEDDVEEPDECVAEVHTAVDSQDGQSMVGTWFIGVYSPRLYSEGVSGTLKVSYNLLSTYVPDADSTLALPRTMPTAFAALESIPLTISTESYVAPGQWKIFRYSIPSGSDGRVTVSTENPNAVRVFAGAAFPKALFDFRQEALFNSDGTSASFEGDEINDDQIYIGVVAQSDASTGSTFKIDVDDISDDDDSDSSDQATTGYIIAGVLGGVCLLLGAAVVMYKRRAAAKQQDPLSVAMISNFA
eukprot:TRINITY_DN1677_c0_g1::TRINITY_DN1677_c0_g1_i1::g.17772::m.17772 TRINITY_DN1677_c0_g1::TRINITY_DN1677_c0_g1_i1::g.17772  ORF type:complete len:1297 (-),score=442.73,sp/Q00689/GP63_LEIGU/32.14/2e-56,Peptidase_M8/PF01457.11/1.3e-98,EGF_2/PF07974.8/1.1e+04,EGF_2/PF07974.8/0.00082,EGF_2/PF07974.8/7.5e-05,EGF_2/PF07974.8/0.0013,EGF_2/PF07974.8/0.18,EGF_2/PF07974.8/0.32,hEGF/PF12661.2/1.1e+03,hEGF/PF12661.2/0.013,hEGF/PF12661.2/0.43,hEGF/PF12661.2/5.1,hEGF/PF12661.2/1.8,hEGF/PF12661.2/1.4e+02 TRINITY_D